MAIPTAMVTEMGTARVTVMVMAMATATEMMKKMTAIPGIVTATLKVMATATVRATTMAITRLTLLPVAMLTGKKVQTPSAAV
jgi:hypothetical protein